MSTIIDVARLAGVSLSTVSHVLNGTRPVRDQTRQRVLAAIEETQFQPHSGARSLRRSKTESVGLVLSDTSQPAFADMIRGVEEEARAAGFTLLLANSRGDAGRELESLRVMRERRVDGLLIAEEGAAADRRLLDMLRSWSAPVVLIDRLSAPDLDQVGVDAEPAMRALVRHLVELGHERIALIAGDPANATLNERLRGYRGIMEEAGYSTDGLALTIPQTAPVQDAVLLLMASAQRPTAFVTSSTVLTVETLRVAKKLGLRAPDDYALATFDTIANSELFTPQLTSVDQPAVQIGREGMRMLLERIGDRDLPPRTLRLPAVIIHGDSCGCAPPRPELRVT